MAQGAGLNAQQKQFLDLAVSDPYLVDAFYLSGGTALSYWYLHHRQSDDLDFFSLHPFDYEKIVRWFRHHKQPLGYSHIRFDEDYGFLTADVRFADGNRLRVDFNHYCNTKLASGTRWRGLAIDGLVDITVNKLQTISTLPRTRDYVDFYFILRMKSWTLNSLIDKRLKKFREETDPLQSSIFTG